MDVVPLNEIPVVAQIQDVPLDKPMEVFKVYQQMVDVCENNQGIGLSAVQVGLPWRLFLVKNKDKFECFVNCEYEPVSDEKFITMEGCLSLRNASGGFRQFQVERYQSVRVRGTQLNVDGPKFEEIDISFKDDFMGVVFQHEIDHQNGILISDLGQEMEIW